MKRLLDWLLSGCSHRRLSFPLTPAGRKDFHGTYVVCLRCGKEFGYDWQAMKIGARSVASLPRLLVEEAVR